LQRIFPMKIS
jgi:hypothetical protein